MLTLKLKAYFYPMLNTNGDAIGLPIGLNILLRYTCFVEYNALLNLFC